MDDRSAQPERHGGGRFYCETLATTDAPPLDPAQTRHLFRVLRAEVGDRFELFDGAGVAAEVELVGPTPPARLRIRRRWSNAPPTPRIGVAVPPLPPGRFDLLASKFTELGVADVIPLLTRRRPPDVRRRLERALTRWRRLAIEAAKQSGNRWLPILRPPATVPELAAAAAPGDALMVAAMTPDAAPLADVMAALERPARCVFVIGPEGDFADDELDHLRSAGARAVDLGPRVLRVETAALVAAVAGSIFFSTRRSDPADPGSTGPGTP